MNRLPLRPRNPDPGAPGLWRPSVWFLAQINHVIAGLFLYPFIFIAHWPAWVPFAVLLGWATIKEFWLDLFVLEHDSVNGSAQDWLAYTIGGGAVMLSLGSLWVGAAVMGTALVALMLWDIAEQNGVFPYD